MTCGKIGKKVTLMIEEKKQKQETLKMELLDGINSGVEPDKSKIAEYYALSHVIHALEELLK